MFFFFFWKCVLECIGAISVWIAYQISSCASPVKNVVKIVCKFVQARFIALTSVVFQLPTRMLFLYNVYLFLNKYTKEKAVCASVGETATIV